MIVPPLEMFHRLLRSPAHFRTTSDRVALTFDDGPEPTRTPQALELLATFGVTATFFLVGERAERHPALVRQIVAEGHEVASHGFTHRAIWKRSVAAFDDDLARASEVLGALTGAAPRAYRPAYAWARAELLPAVAARSLELVLWSVDSLDWTRAPAGLVARAASSARPGDTVLFHDGNPRALGTLPGLRRWLEQARRAGLSVRAWASPGSLA